MQAQLHFNVIKEHKCYRENLTIVIHCRHTLTSCRTDGKIHDKTIVLCRRSSSFEDCVIGWWSKSIDVPVRCNAKRAAILRYCQFQGFYMVWTCDARCVLFTEKSLLNWIPPAPTAPIPLMSAANRVGSTLASGSLFLVWVQSSRNWDVY